MQLEEEIYIGKAESQRRLDEASVKVGRRIDC
jgi:hypothetical protein